MRPEDACDPRFHYLGVSRRTVATRPLSLGEQWSMPAIIDREGMDLVHVPHLNVPLLARTPLIATIHDLIPFHYPEAIAARFGLPYFRAMSCLVPRKARRVLTVSDHTRQDLIRLAGADPARIDLVPLGVDDAFAREVAPTLRQAVRRRFGLADRYLLYAGQWKAYKNVELLLDVMERLAPAFGDVKLVLVGKEDPRVALRERLVARHLEDRVVLTGYVDENELAALYQEATCFVFPSRCEGFGLPPLEAMAAGVPVVASDRASLPEVVGDAGLLLDPDAVLEWTQAIEALCDDPARRRQLVERGRERIKSFRWELTAARTVESYRRALG